MFLVLMSIIRITNRLHLMVCNILTEAIKNYSNFTSISNVERKSFRCVFILGMDSFEVCNRNKASCLFLIQIEIQTNLEFNKTCIHASDETNPFRISQRKYFATLIIDEDMVTSGKTKTKHNRNKIDGYMRYAGKKLSRFPQNCHIALSIHIAIEPIKAENDSARD